MSISDTSSLSPFCFRLLLVPRCCQLLLSCIWGCPAQIKQYFTEVHQPEENIFSFSFYFSPSFPKLTPKSTFWVPWHRTSRSSVMGSIPVFKDNGLSHSLWPLLTQQEKLGAVVWVIKPKERDILCGLGKWFNWSVPGDESKHFSGNICC